MLYCRTLITMLFLTAVQVFGAEGRIAFYRHQGPSQVYTMNGDGSNLTQVTRTFGISYFGGLDWSPDGQQLAVEQWKDSGGYGIFLLRLGVPDEPTLLVEYGHWPRWSPDGRRVLFIFDKEIRVIDVDGSNQVTVVQDAFGPTWSPDGRRIAYTTWQFLSGRKARGAIWTSNADGTHPTQITTTPLPGIPDWSPDGKKIVFAGREGEDIDTDPQIYVVDLENGALTQLTDNLRFISGPSWSPTGSQIVFSQWGNIWSMDADGNNKVQLTDNPRPDISFDPWALDDNPVWWGEGLSTVIQSLTWGQIKALRW